MAIAVEETTRTVIDQVVDGDSWYGIVYAADGSILKAAVACNRAKVEALLNGTMKQKRGPRRLKGL